MTDNSNQKSSNTITPKIITGTSPTLQNGKKRNKRKRNRGKKNPARVQIKRLQAPVKEYVSKCCGVSAKKKSTGTPLNAYSNERTKDLTAVTGLGGWRCSACSKACKVTPQAPKPKEEAPVETHV